MPQIYIDFTRRIIEGMGGSGPSVETAAREIYQEWAACHHFFLYDDVPDVLRELHARGLKIGLISNSHRCMESFQSHFALEGLFAAAVTSAEHGFMKPHPSIFETALRQVAAEPAESVMVGDSVAHDVEGARRLGMRAVLRVAFAPDRALSARRARDSIAARTAGAVVGFTQRNASPPTPDRARCTRQPARRHFHPPADDARRVPLSGGDGARSLGIHGR